MTALLVVRFCISLLWVEKETLLVMLVLLFARKNCT
jgi:hypothetical protein